MTTEDAGAGSVVTAGPSVQLRVYAIEPGHLDDFVAAWTAGVVPLRRQFGFEAQAWTVPDEDTFVWVLRYDGTGSFEQANEAYYASAERQRLDPDPAQWIARNDTRWLSPVAEPDHRP